MEATKKPTTAAICGILFLLIASVIASIIIYLFLAKVGMTTIPTNITEHIRNHYGNAITVVGYAVMLGGLFYGMFAVANNIRKTNQQN